VNEPISSVLLVRCSATNQTATLVCQLKGNGQFVACCREDAGDRREATGVGDSDRDAIFDAAMELFETKPFSLYAALDYGLESDDEICVGDPNGMTFEEASAFPWPRGRIPYSVMYGMKYKMVRRPRLDSEK